jgi:hypothetical protein
MREVFKKISEDEKFKYFSLKVVKFEFEAGL